MSNVQSGGVEQMTITMPRQSPSEPADGSHEPDTLDPSVIAHEARLDAAIAAVRRSRS